MDNRDFSSTHGSEEKDIVDITQLINPFPGLRPFGIEESHLFFGREGQSDEVLYKLSENKFVAILGASGSGKSSLMYCGLIPTLYGGFMTQAGSSWQIIVTRPGGGPIDNLAESLLTKDPDFSFLSEEDKRIRKTIISTVLKSSSLGLIEVVRQLKLDDFQNILIMVDQFEELFRYKKIESESTDQDESSAYVNLLLEAIHQYEEPIYIALTMRSDFIGDCAQYPDLTQVINDSHYLIPQMTRDQKRAAIEGPIAVGGGKITPRLTQQLLNDVGDRPDQLPILQHALMRTWSFWTKKRKAGESLDLRHYNAVGTLQEALSLHANEAYDSLSLNEKEICETMFKALTEKGTENQGIRRPTKLSVIAEIAEAKEIEVIEIIERFREPGRSLLLPPFGIKLESDTIIDISHESLMRIWIRLKRWLDEESKAAEMYLRLSETAERYQEGKAGLWLMPDLQLALNWREENKPTLVWGQRYHVAFERTMVFLETSENAYLTEIRNKETLQKRQVGRIRATALVLFVATLICLILVIYSRIQSKEADNQRIRAEQLFEDAQASANKAIEEELKALDAAAQAIKAQMDAEKASDSASTNLLRAQEAEMKATQEAYRANEQAEKARKAEETAVAQQIIAEEKRVEAEKATKRANEASERAKRLRKQSIASSMAIKSKTIVIDDYSSTQARKEAELKGLVARQAYLFYEEAKDLGRDYNGDIYAGVYSAIKDVYHVIFQNKIKGDSAFNWYGLERAVGSKNRSIGVRSVIYSKDGKSLYAAYSNGNVIQWDVATRNQNLIFDNSDIARVINISNDEKYLACGTDRNNILIFNTNDFSKKPNVIDAHQNGKVFDLVFLPNDKGFVSIGSDNRILISDFLNVKEIYKSKQKINKIAIAPDASKLAGGALDGTVYIWNLNKESKKPYTLFGLNNSTKRAPSIDAIKFSPNGEFLAYGNEEGAIVIWDMHNNQQITPILSGFRAPVTDIEFSPDNRLILATSTNSQVRIWDLNNVFDLPIVLNDYAEEGTKGWVNDASFSPDGEQFVTAAGDGNIRLYSLNPLHYVNEICQFITHGNMSDNEWRQFVGDDIEYVPTCDVTIKRSNE